jgi:response regulator RpfG family c-di-GMP phosphodiesterase
LEGNNDGDSRDSDNTSINNKDYQNNPYKIYTVSVSNLNKDILDQQHSQQHQQKQEHANNNNIMIVDDEKDILLTYKAILAESGYNVKTFTNPYDALLHFAQADPVYYKLVILDIRIPNLNGLQLYNRLKAINKDIKIVFLSALDAAKELVSMIPCANSNDIIIGKPVEKEYLVNKVKAELA